MPRNGSSVYSLPAGNPVIPGTTIATAWANGTLTDIATALTQSLSTDGSTASASMSGKTLVGGTYDGPAVTGTLTLTGGKIAFPAVQIPDAGANVLDDYEEGTWTPTLTFGTPGNLTVAYSNRIGRYTKIGRSVNLTVSVTTSTWTHTTASGDFAVTGMPFASAATGTGISAVAATLWNGVSSTTTIQLNLAVIAADTSMKCYATVTGAASVFLTATSFPTTVQQQVHGSVTYDS